MPNEETAYVHFSDAEAFAQRLLSVYAVPDKDAAVVASCLVRADLRGVGTHGLIRLPTYIDRLERGLLNPKAVVRPEHPSPVVTIIDGQNGFGFVAATRAMTEAIDAAREFGIGMTAVKRSTHFGMASCYSLQAVAAGMVSIVFTNASRAMPPWGAREALIGTSPMAFGTPTPNGGSIVLDMSPAVAARGKIRQALIRGEQIPIGYALDANGSPTTDPAAALEGVVLPIGGPKGSGLSLFMDIFGGVLTGAAFGGDVGDMTRDFDRPQNVGHLFFAIRPNLFLPGDEYLARIETLVERVKACAPAESFTEILLPGEQLESRSEQRSRRDGITYSVSEVAALDKEAERANVALLVREAKPLGR